MLSRIVSSNSSASCVTTESRVRSAAGSRSRRSAPPSSTAPASRVQEPRDEVEDRALARPRRTDQRGRPPLGHHQRQVVEHRRPAIGERDPAQLDPRPLRQRAGPGGREDRGARVQHLAQPLQARRGLAPEAREPGEAPDRLEGERHRREEGHELAHPSLARGDGVAAPDQHAEEPDAGHQVHEAGIAARPAAPRTSARTRSRAASRKRPDW